MNPLASFGGGFSDSGSAVASTGSKTDIGGINFARRAGPWEKAAYAGVAVAAVTAAFMLLKR